VAVEVSGGLECLKLVILEKRAHRLEAGARLNAGYLGPRTEAMILAAGEGKKHGAGRALRS
jgi:hypothetical protein